MKAISDILEYRDGFLYWKSSPFRGFTNSGKIAGQPNGHGYLEIKTKQITGESRVYQVHRLVWEMHHGYIPDGMVVDHKNRDITDNRIENLRLASRSENSMNAVGKSNRYSGLPKNVYVDFTYKGVTKYRAQICVRGKLHRQGKFTSPEEAFIAAQEMRKALHGEFARATA